ncbi:tetratricopeptide repeat protein [Candidatus Leptofilum sp.]|uniref:tetratricopeptide repeat protein n=1 Tax=Candidatus Leptofilum sp. TaxID=3241576 RepID=UPI003B5B5465
MKITITQTDDRFEPPFATAVQFNNGAGHKVTITDPFTPEEEERLEWYYEKWLTFPFTGEVKAGKAAASTQSYGEALFQQLFADRNADRRYAQAVAKGFQNLSFEIRGTPAFHALHWEALKDPQLARPFAVECSFLRQNDTPPPIDVQLKPSPTLNILLVSARPDGRRDVGYRTISRPLIEALQNSRLRTRIDLVRPGTYEALVKHLEASRDQHGDGFYHIAHFDLHGALLTYEQYQQLEPDAPNPHLYKGYGQDKIEEFEGEKAFLSFNGAKEGESNLVSDDTVAGLLASHQIPIAILNACQSGKQVGASETSLGSRLMATGVQNALAMGYSVSVSAAELLMTTLYEQLLAGQPLAQAVRRGRLELRNSKARRAAYNQMIELEDWLLPVMYQNREIQLPITDFATPEAEEVYFERQSRRYRAPTLTYGFFGRDVDILSIETHLLTQSNVLLIQGMGGAGKTTLLRHLMEWEQTTQLVERVFYFGYDEKAYTAAQIIDALARELYGADYTHTFSPLPDGAKLEKLAQTLRSERHLLVLDNLESITGAALSIQHTLDGAEQAKLRQLLGRLAGGKTLVLLGSRGREEWLWGDELTEQVYELPGLDGEAASDLAKLILQRHQADHYLADEAERPALTQLLKLLDGHPLALEIVLPNLSRQTPTELLAAFTEGDEGIDVQASNTQTFEVSETSKVSSTGLQDKTASILRCVEYSHSNLSPGAQALLACLTPFTGVFNADWLLQYTKRLQEQPALADLPFAEWETVLQEGLNWGLLTLHEIGGGYLRLQPILPYFLRQRLRDPAQAPFREAVEAAFCAHYDTVGSTLAQLIKSKELQERQTGLALTDLEYENLMTALKWALAKQGAFYDAYEALFRFLYEGQLHQQALEVSQLVWDAHENFDSQQMAGRIGEQFSLTLNRLGLLQLGLRNYTEAQKAYEDELKLVENFTHYSEDAKGKSIGNSYHQLGRVTQEQRLWETAVAHYEKALALKIEFNDRYSQAPSYFQLGSVAQEQRQWDTAVAHYEKALAITDDFGGGYDQARIYHQLGMVAQEQRQWKTAVTHYEKALALKFEFNDRYSQASTYHQLGIVAEKQRQWDTAVAHYEKALAIFIEFNDRYTQASTYHQLGMVAEKQRQWDTAVAHYEKALALKIEFNHRYGQASTYHQLGRVAEAQEKWQEATNYLLQTLAIDLEFNDEHGAGITMRSIQRVWQASQDSSIATRLAALLNISSAEAEALLNNQAGGGSGNN